jgi:hypothetical protein
VRTAIASYTAYSLADLVALGQAMRLADARPATVLLDPPLALTLERETLTDGSLVYNIRVLDTP